MTLTPAEAASHLKEAEAMQRRSARAYGYRCFSPHLILWGIVWVLGYGATYFFPHAANLIWPCLCLPAWFLSAYLGQKNRVRQPAGYGWRMLGLIGAICIFFVTLYALIGPVTGPQAAALPAFVVGLVYFGIGIWTKPRLAVTGAVIYLLTLGGYFLLAPYFLLWMALVGGGGLILGGLWMRKV